jgi:peroxiredoxin Q/BCP
VIGVSRDPMKAIEKFAEKYRLTFPLASDESGKVSEAYGTWVEKSMYGRKYLGMERATFLIDGAGRVARVWRNVKVPGHVAQVMAAVRELG